MSELPRLMPADPQMFRATVLATARVSPSFQRVTLGGPALDGFAWQGHDHWFRLFVPATPGAALVLPEVEGRSWWQAYLAIEEAQRPHCSNYTVADLRRTGTGTGTKIDVDVVLHTDGAGHLAGRVARWAVSATPGTPVALLDQGPMFDPPADTRRVHLAADESGLPGVRGILRDLAPGTTGTAVIEVPTDDDVEPGLVHPAGVEVTWVSRGGRHDNPGAAALQAVQARTGQVDPFDYAFVVGESTLATGGRRHLRRSGLPAARICFSGFYKAHPRPQPVA